MNPRLQSRLLRQPAPAIVPYLIDAIDRADPTRSHEAKPSARMREARHHRRLVRACFVAAAVVAGMCMTAVSLN